MMAFSPDSSGICGIRVQYHRESWRASICETKESHTIAQYIVLHSYHKSNCTRGASAPI